MGIMWRYDSKKYYDLGETKFDLKYICIQNESLSQQSNKFMLIFLFIFWLRD